MGTVCCLIGKADGTVAVRFEDGTETDLGTPYILEVETYTVVERTDVLTWDACPSYQFPRTPPEVRLRLALGGDVTLRNPQTAEDLSINELFGVIQSKIAERDNNQ